MTLGAAVEIDIGVAYASIVLYLPSSGVEMIAHGDCHAIHSIPRDWSVGGGEELDSNQPEERDRRYEMDAGLKLRHGGDSGNAARWAINIRCGLRGGIQIEITEAVGPKLYFL
jgi:hypothetical protein